MGGETVAPARLPGGPQVGSSDVWPGLLLPLLPEPATNTLLGVRASKPGASFSSQSGSPQPLPSAMGGTGCLQQEEMGTSPRGGMLAVGSLQKGAPWAPWNQNFLVLERPAFWALVSQAESRLRPKSWPGSLGDPVTFPKGGVSGRGQVMPVFIPASILLPTWGPADGLF